MSSNWSKLQAALPKRKRKASAGASASVSWEVKASADSAVEKAKGSDQQAAEGGGLMGFWNGFEYAELVFDGFLNVFGGPRRRFC